MKKRMGRRLPQKESGNIEKPAAIIDNRPPREVTREYRLAYVFPLSKGKRECFPNEWAQNLKSQFPNRSGKILQKNGGQKDRTRKIRE
jgi:hypothetical protein